MRSVTQRTVGGSLVLFSDWNLRPKMAGYACDFVEQLPASNRLFICEICKLVLRQPHITQCCGKNACKLCIAKKADNREPCPIPGCKNQCVKITFNRDLDYDVLRRRVHCSSRNSGCQWGDTLENLEKHLQECPFLEVECQNFCGIKVQQRLVKEHEAVCERFPVNCDQCGSMYERRDKSNHVAVCSLTKVTCPFSIVGCTTEMLNKDLPQHFEECLSDHYALVAKQSQEVQAEIGGKRELAQNVEPLLAQEMKVATLNGDIVAAETEMIELQRALEEAQVEFLELKEKQSQVKIALQQQIREEEASTLAVREERNRLESVAKERCYGPGLPRLNPADITSRPPDSAMTTEEYVPEVSFMIPRFEEERKNDACLYLPPFYSRRGGYKMCLMVYCNGMSEVKGKFVSIYLRSLYGKYDKGLNWPLRCKVDIEIESARKGLPNLKRTIEVRSQSPVPEDRCFSKGQEYGCYRRALCLSATIGYQNITSYLLTGCLTIKIAKVMIN